MRKKLPDKVYNTITLMGAGIASISFCLILFLSVLDALASEQNPYFGIITFIVLPSILIFGLLLIAYGIYREDKRLKRGDASAPQLPQIDMNDPRQRRAVTIFAFGTIILLMFTAFGSFKAYEYTESDRFCGETCHKVMEPEFTAYQASPHSKVGCVNCHIGPGTGWFVKSKLSGSYQVYSVLFDKYPRPIPTPIEDLRPARETCEQCHWTKHLYFQKMRKIDYYSNDETNSKWSLKIAMNIGEGNSETGFVSGIHWHVNSQNEITYKTSDKKRMEIPWVKIKHASGEEIVYKVKGYSDQGSGNETTTRVMDCIDCHNRPAHIYYPSTISVNNYISLGWIDKSIPFIKSVATQALDKGYTTKEIALDSIRQFVEDFYKQRFAGFYNGNSNKIDNAIAQIQKIFKRNYFPEMGVSWKNYPMQIGHMYAPGCFRCHDGKHVSDKGKVISKDCNLCHTILQQQYENEEPQFSGKGLEYKHPVEIGKALYDMNCSDCHTKSL